MLWPFSWTSYFYLSLSPYQLHCSSHKGRDWLSLVQRTVAVRTWCEGQPWNAGRLCPCWKVCLGERWGLNSWSVSFRCLPLLSSCQIKAVTGTGQAHRGSLKNTAVYIVLAYPALLLAVRFPFTYIHPPTFSVPWLTSEFWSLLLYVSLCLFYSDQLIWWNYP